MKRRGFLGALAALACAPFVPKETLTKLFRKPLLDKPLPNYGFPIRWTKIAIPTSLEDIEPAVLKQMEASIKELTRRMLEDSNKWMFTNGEVYDALPKKLQVRYDAGDREFFNHPLWRGLTSGKE